MAKKVKTAKPSRKIYSELIMHLNSLINARVFEKFGV